MKRLTRAKAIREKCIDCMCGNKTEVRRCVSRDCALFPYRLGHEDKGVYNLSFKEEEAENRAKNA